MNLFYKILLGSFKIFNCKYEHSFHCELDAAMHNLAVSLKNTRLQIAGVQMIILVQTFLSQLQKTTSSAKFELVSRKISRNLDAVILGMHAKKIIQNS